MLKFHNGGTVTSASNQQTTKIQIQSPTQTIANAQVCLDPLALTDVDVRTNHTYYIDVVHYPLFFVFLFMILPRSPFSIHFFFDFETSRVFGF